MKIIETKCASETVGQPILGGVIPGGTCASPLVVRIASGHVMTMICQIGDVTMSTTATLRGDYARRVRFDFVMDATGPAVLSRQGQRRMRSTMRAVRLGDCPAER